MELFSNLGTVFDVCSFDAKAMVLDLHHQPSRTTCFDKMVFHPLASIRIMLDLLCRIYFFPITIYIQHCVLLFLEVCFSTFFFGFCNFRPWKKKKYLDNHVFFMFSNIESVTRIVLQMRFSCKIPCRDKRAIERK